MAKKRTSPLPAAGTQNGESTSAYFKRVFAEKPSLLFTKSNAELLQRWLADHPGHSAVPENIKANLANIKSVMRRRTRKRGRPRKVDQAAPAATAVTVSTMKPPRAAVRGLETLEEQIDDCLTMARSLNREELGDIIRLLRKARNEVVWKMGEP